jgi:hypothetical protein
MLSQVKDLIYSVNWGSPAYFYIEELSLVNRSFSDNSMLHSSFFFHKLSDRSKKFINTSILSVNTPNVTSQPIEEWVGGRWMYTNGRQELRQVELTFRDTADGLLWKNFIYIYDFLQNKYPEDCYWNLSLTTKSMESINRNDSSGNSGATLIGTSTALLSSISPLNFSKDNPDAFLTFSVIFKYFNSGKTTEDIRTSKADYAL